MAAFVQVFGRRQRRPNARGIDGPLPVGIPNAGYKKYDGNRRSGGLGRQRRGRASRCDDYRGLPAHQFGGHLRQTVQSIFRPGVGDCHILTFGKAELFEDCDPTLSRSTPRHYCGLNSLTSGHQIFCSFSTKALVCAGVMFLIGTPRSS